MFVFKFIFKSNLLLYVLIKFNFLFNFCFNENIFYRFFFEGYEIKSNFEDVFENILLEVGFVVLGIFYFFFVYGGW